MSIEYYIAIIISIIMFLAALIIKIYSKYSRHTKKPLVYLAIPYSHPDHQIKEWRFAEANKMAAKLMKEGVVVFSPISHCHSIALHNSLPTNWEFWKHFDTAFLSCSSKLLVYKLEGWETSVGVTSEIKIAKELGIPIEYLEYEPEK